jgi:hypothetical protein
VVSICWFAINRIEGSAGILEGSILAWCSAIMIPYTLGWLLTITLVIIQIFKKPVQKDIQT